MTGRCSNRHDDGIDPQRALRDITLKMCRDEVRRCTVAGRYVGDPEVLVMAQLLGDPLYEPFLDRTFYEICHRHVRQQERIDPGNAVNGMIRQHFLDETRKCTVAGEYAGNPSVLLLLQQLTDPLYAPFLDGRYEEIRRSVLEAMAEKKEDL